MIDYRKLKLAHELARKYSLKGDDVINVTIHFMNGGCSYWLSGSNIPEDEYNDLDAIILQLEELNPLEVKYKKGQTVWRLNDEYEPESFVISEIDPSSEEMYLQDEENGWWLEEQLYPSREALIEAQVDYWLGMLEMPKQIRYFAKQAKTIPDEEC